MDRVSSSDAKTGSSQNATVWPARIAVDLDETLISTDLLWESTLRYSMTRPWRMINVVRWLLRGKAALKSELASRVPLDATLLPYRQNVLDELQRQKTEGARIILATASSSAYADAVAAHLGIFEAVIATAPDGENIRSATKAASIAEHFGDADWTYYGDAKADLQVWDRSAGAVLVDAAPAVRHRVAELGIPARVINSPRTPAAKAWLKQIRVHQWAKNLLVLLPLFAAHMWTLPALGDAVLAFFSFSFAASSVYIWNDLKDLDSDRAHRTKRRRPLAAGRISIPAGIGAALTLAALALVLGLLVGWLFTGALLVYAIVTSLYTVWLKRRIVVDVVTLALLYTWRIVAGCAAILVAPSIWILAFSTFLFFSLALMKRYAELVNHASHARGRGYTVDDTTLLLSSGVASGVAAALVLTLYLDSPQVAALYPRPFVMWALVPLILAWLTRTWMLATRKKMDDDPVVFAIRDRTSQIVILLAAIIVFAASI